MRRTGVWKWFPTPGRAVTASPSPRRWRGAGLHGTRLVSFRRNDLNGRALVWTRRGLVIDPPQLLDSRCGPVLNSG